MNAWRNFEKRIHYQIVRKRGDTFSEVTFGSWDILQCCTPAKKRVIVERGDKNTFLRNLSISSMILRCSCGRFHRFAYWQKANFILCLLAEILPCCIRFSPLNLIEIVSQKEKSKNDLDLLCNTLGISIRNIYFLDNDYVLLVTSVY